MNEGQNAVFKLPSDENRRGRPQLTVRFQRYFDDFDVLEAYEREYHSYIAEDFMEYDHILRFLELMSIPFDIDIYRRADPKALT